MSRKKTAKRAVKRQKTTQKSIKATSPLQQMEKEFKQTAAKVTAQLKADINKAKQQVAKIKAAYAKAAALQNKADARLKNAQKSASTARGKKQLKAATKQRNAAVSIVANVAKQLTAAEKALDNANQSRAKLVALSKHVAQFEQIWVKNLKSLNKPKPAKKIKRKSAVKNLAVVENPMLQSIQPLSTTESDGDLDNAMEVAS